jgi:hypothetical protein
VVVEDNFRSDIARIRERIDQVQSMTVLSSAATTRSGRARRGAGAAGVKASELQLPYLSKSSIAK